MSHANWQMKALMQAQAESGRGWEEFLTLPSMSLGLYRVLAGTNDRGSHDPHDRDEVYVGMSGEGAIHLEGDDIRVVAGSVVFVAAGTKHYFHDVTEDLTMLVFFAGNSPAS